MIIENKQQALALVRDIPDRISGMRAEFRDDEEIACEAVKNDPITYTWASQRLKESSLELALLAARRGQVLYHMPKEIRCRIEVVQEAVKTYPEAIYFLDNQNNDFLDHCFTICSETPITIELLPEAVRIYIAWRLDNHDSCLIKCWLDHYKNTRKRKLIAQLKQYFSELNKRKFKTYYLEPNQALKAVQELQMPIDLALKQIKTEKQRQSLAELMFC